MIEKIKKEFLDETSTDSVYLKNKYLGKKGLIGELQKELKNLSDEEKPIFGKELNILSTDINKRIGELFQQAADNKYLESLKETKIDLTYPGIKPIKGAVNPLLKTRYELEKIFINIGYKVAEGPELELIEYNFDKLNIQEDHPSRDASDTFYVDDKWLLRSQTSPVQVREMLKCDQELKIICPGKVYRKDEDDATHSHQFMQIEIMAIDKDITVGDLKGTLIESLNRIFPESGNIRMRPSYFPFTEPSFEVDVECFKCHGEDESCSICKGTGFIEVLGCGIVHPKVLEHGGYNPDEYSGFAIGMGIERIAMLKYGINDIRSFYNNNLNYLKQYDRIEGGDLDEII